MAEKLVIQLVPESNLTKPEPTLLRKLTLPLILMMLGAFVSSVVTHYTLKPLLPESLTPTQAAKILKVQQGFAGYSLIKTEGGEGGLGHDIFCPHCGSPIAEVRVTFLEEREPQPGSRMALMTDLAKSALAADTKKLRKPSTIAPVIAYKGETK